MGTLYVVGTPIGNLEDITLRALRVLREVAFIAAEDTRTTRKLLNRYEISAPIVSYLDHSKPERLEWLLNTLQESDGALVSEAGMPGVSDPGYELVRAAWSAGVQVVPIPGPSAVLAALAVSGLPSDRFLFLGFLPRRQSERRRLLRSVADQPGAIVAFEAPHRLLASLSDLQQILGCRPLTVCRELTKIHEEVWRGITESALDYFGTLVPRGEYTLVLGGTEGELDDPKWLPERVQSAVDELLNAGISPTAAAKAIASLSGWSKRAVYDLGIDLAARQRENMGQS